MSVAEIDMSISDEVATSRSGRRPRRPGHVRRAHLLRRRDHYRLAGCA